MSWWGPSGSLRCLCTQTLSPGEVRGVGRRGPHGAGALGTMRGPPPRLLWALGS